MSDASDTHFRIRVIEQGFAEPHPETDWVVGGSIELVIAGIKLLGPDEEDIGISKTALQLSRTLTEDHVAEDMTTYLVMHNCGLGSQPGCDHGIDWDVTYGDGHITISNVQDHWSTSPRVDRSLTATMSPAEYRAEVAAFCRETLAFAEAHPRDFANDALYAEDWRVWQEEVRDRLVGGTTRFYLFPDGVPDGVGEPRHGRLRRLWHTSGRGSADDRQIGNSTAMMPTATPMARLAA